MTTSFVEQIVKTNQSAIETATAIADLGLDSLEKLSTHQLASSRRALVELGENTRHLLQAKGVQDLAAIQGPGIENSIAYFRGFYDIASAHQAALRSLLEERQGELGQTLNNSLAWLPKSGQHSEVATAAVKSAISAANSAFEQVNKAARQVAEIAEASVNAASTATARAIGTAGSARKKAA